MQSLLWQSVLQPYQRLPVETEREGERVGCVWACVGVFHRDGVWKKKREVGQTLGSSDRISHLEEGVLSPLTNPFYRKTSLVFF